MENKKINLEKGYVLVYDFGNVKVHNYNTCDYIDDQVILLEKNNKMVIIESPSFYDNNRVLEDYINSLNVTIDGILLSYHMAGGSFLTDTKKFSTKKAIQFGYEGEGKELINNFVKSFGDAFDNTVHHITDYINDGKIILADIEMNIIPTFEAYDIEIPEINCIYTHMLGSESHSIISSVENAKLMIKTLNEYINKNYNLIFTSHYIPENITAVKTKIAYIQNLLDIASQVNSATEMIERMKKEYPNYGGLNYLEMTANAFFPSNK